MDENTALYKSLCHKLNTQPDRRGWARCTCPECGEERQRKAAFNTGGFNCFVCGAKMPLHKLAESIGVNGKNADRLPPIKKRQPKPRYWFREPDLWLQKTLEHPQRLELWQSYRPFTIDTISRWKLGVGVVPSTPCSHARLTYPYDDNGRVTLRGRLLDCDCDERAMKWLTAGGGKAALWGVELLAPRAAVVLCESPVDAMLLMQNDPELVAIAPTAGASTWRKEWTQAIVDTSPSLVVVAYDNDLQGQAMGQTRATLAREWLEKRPRLPVANGPKVANYLLRAGLTVRLYDWKDAPPKADVGWMLTQDAS